MANEEIKSSLLSWGDLFEENKDFLDKTAVIRLYRPVNVNGKDYNALVYLRLPTDQVITILADIGEKGLTLAIPQEIKSMIENCVVN